MTGWSPAVVEASIDSRATRTALAARSVCASDHARLFSRNGTQPGLRAVRSTDSSSVAASKYRDSRRRIEDSCTRSHSMFALLPT